MSILSSFIKATKGKTEIYPLIGILSFALSGAVYFGTRAIRSPDVVWNSKTNPHPWQDVKEGEQVKLIALNQKYNQRWERKNW